MNYLSSYLDAIQQWLRMHVPKSLKDSTRVLAESYRTGGTSDVADMAAYIASRAPATYAAVTKALHMSQAGLASMAPHSLLDVGAGAGSASWAATGFWPSLEHITFLDSNPAFLGVAQELAKQADSAALRASESRLQNVTGSALPSADIVCAAYMLAELPETDAKAMALRLWDATTMVVVIVEPGTPRGFARIRLAREALLAAGASIAGPCTHANGCPIVEPDWCHFKVRLNRSRVHMHAKSARVPFEDEPFSFVVAHRGSQHQGHHRIVAPPEMTKPAMALRLCTHAGMQEISIAKRDKARFKSVRKLAWGDIFKEDQT